MSEIVKNGHSENVKKPNLEFHRVQNPKLLTPILEQRLPLSCYIYNQVISSDKFENDLEFYTISNEINLSTWILTVYKREDHGRFLSISAPENVARGYEEVPKEVKECLSCGHVIDWDANFWFCPLTKPLSAMIYDICVNVKGNVTEMHPSVLFYFEREDSLNRNINPPPEAKISRLDLEKDTTDFVLRTWKYSKEGSEIVIPKCIRGNASAGVYVNGKCVSCVHVAGNGLFHNLYTESEYRGKGYAKSTLYFACKQLVMDGGIPCSAVEIKNKGSIGFHESAGAKIASITDFIRVQN